MTDWSALAGRHKEIHVSLVHTCRSIGWINDYFAGLYSIEQQALLHNIKTKVQATDSVVSLKLKTHLKVHEQLELIHQNKGRQSGRKQAFRGSSSSDLFQRNGRSSSFSY